MVMVEEGVAPAGGGEGGRRGYQNLTSANKRGVQILVILWERNSWMHPFCIEWFLVSVFCRKFQNHNDHFIIVYDL